MRCSASQCINTQKHIKTRKASKTYWLFGIQATLPVVVPPRVMSNMMSGAPFSSAPELNMSTLILICSDCPHCRPYIVYRHTDHVCKNQESKATAKSDADLLQRVLSHRIQLQSGTSCKGISSLRCRRQINLASSTIVYLVLVLLINAFCRFFLPCRHLHSMQNLKFVIARHALTVTGKLCLKAISS